MTSSSIDAYAATASIPGELKVIQDATCTFCGCVCDDIDLTVKDDHIIEANETLSYLKYNFGSKTLRLNNILVHIYILNYDLLVIQSIRYILKKLNLRSHIFRITFKYYYSKFVLVTYHAKKYYNNHKLCI